MKLCNTRPNKEVHLCLCQYELFFDAVSNFNIYFNVKIKKMKKIFYTLFLASLIAGCSENMVTGRKQLSLVSETELRSMA